MKTEELLKLDQDKIMRVERGRFSAVTVMAVPESCVKNVLIVRTSDCLKCEYNLKLNKNKVYCKH